MVHAMPAGENGPAIPAAAATAMRHRLASRPETPTAALD
jgi:hypothetical protein